MTPNYYLLVSFQWRFLNRNRMNTRFAGRNSVNDSFAYNQPTLSFFVDFFIDIKSVYKLYRLLHSFEMSPVQINTNVVKQTFSVSIICSLCNIFRSISLVFRILFSNFLRCNSWLMPYRFLHLLLYLLSSNWKLHMLEVLNMVWIGYIINLC